MALKRSLSTITFKNKSNIFQILKRHKNADAGKVGWKLSEYRLLLIVYVFNLITSGFVSELLKTKHIRCLCRFFMPVQTRWTDNDEYGHINNSVYYQFIDLITTNAYYSILGDQVLVSPKYAVVRAETSCSYRKPMHYPQNPLIAAGITKLGRSSVTFSVGFFEPKSPTTESNEPRIGLLGKMLTKDETRTLSEWYHPDANAVGSAVGVFVSTSKLTEPVTILPDMADRLKTVMIEQSDE